MVHRYPYSCEKGEHTVADNKQRRQEAMKNLDKSLSRRDRSEKLQPVGVVVATLVILTVIVGGIWFLTTSGGDEESVNADGNNEAETITPLAAEQVAGDPLPLTRDEELPETVTCEYPEGEPAAKEVSLPATDDVSARGTVTVTLETNFGEIPMELDRAASPCAVNAISHLADEGYYNDTVCHRITGGGLNVLQCGDPSGTGSGGPGFTFADEWPVGDADENAQFVYPRGSIAMANSGPDTNGSQFFLNWADGMLPPAYTLLGMMTEEGIQTIETITENGVVPGMGPSDGAPAEEVTINSATVSS